ncbi:MAG: IS1595 family transposase [Bacteroidetes bacterium]|nr:IS1595 family transposase [Bacteroidota bacterium]
MTFIEFNKTFSNEQDVINHFIKIRYNDKLKCNHCGSDRIYKYSSNQRSKLFRCGDCNKDFSIFKDTIFEKSRTDLIKWMYAIHLFLNSKKGISGYQLQREIGVTYKTAWRMLKQIRKAMNSNNKDHFNAIVEIDETYIGGKPRKENNHKKDDEDDNNNFPTNKRGRGTKKKAVVGIVDRENKKVFAKVTSKNKNGQKLSGIQLLEILNEVCKENNTVMTDEFKSYNILKNTNYIHLKIDHTKNYVDGDIHTNSVESFWAILKRGIYGIYHHVSLKYLQNYINEFCFRYNNRNQNMFDLILKQGVL